jgi:hypothetical protein
MEQFMEEVRAYAARLGVKPTTVIQRVKAGGGSTWASWEAGSSTPTFSTVDKIRRFIADNPPDAIEDAA